MQREHGLQEDISGAACAGFQGFEQAAIAGIEVEPRVTEPTVAMARARFKKTDAPYAGPVMVKDGAQRLRPVALLGLRLCQCHDVTSGWWLLRWRGWITSLIELG